MLLTKKKIKLIENINDMKCIDHDGISIVLYNTILDRNHSMFNLYTNREVHYLLTEYGSEKELRWDIDRSYESIFNKDNFKIHYLSHMTISSNMIKSLTYSDNSKYIIIDRTKYLYPDGVELLESLQSISSPIVIYHRLDTNVDNDSFLQSVKLYNNIHK